MLMRMVCIFIYNMMKKEPVKGNGFGVVKNSALTKSAPKNSIPCVSIKASFKKE